ATKSSRWNSRWAGAERAIPLSGNRREAYGEPLRFQEEALGFNFPTLAPIGLLVLSNVFMTFAWYWHLKFHSFALWAVVLISWGIAFFEYWLAIPANRIGHSVYSAAELKTIQEVISL